jgi:hypothetical protein
MLLHGATRAALHCRREVAHGNGMFLSVSVLACLYFCCSACERLFLFMNGAIGELGYMPLPAFASQKLFSRHSAQSIIARDAIGSCRAANRVQLTLKQIDLNALGYIARFSAIPPRHRLHAPLLPAVQGLLPPPPPRLPQVNASVALALKLYLEIECHRDTLKSATKRLMKMLERKRVEANCVRMVQGTARRHVVVTPCYRFRGIECAL